MLDNHTGLMGVPYHASSLPPFHSFACIIGTLARVRRLLGGGISTMVPSLLSTRSTQVIEPVDTPSKGWGSPGN